MPFHQELSFTCEAANQAARPTKQGEFPRRRATAGEEIAHYALTARGRNSVKSRMASRSAVTAADPSGSRPTAEEQRGKKGEKKR